MERFILDTSICVFLLRNQCDVVKKIREIGIENCYLSEITVAELLYGAECSREYDRNIHMVEEFCLMFDIIPISKTLGCFAKNKAILRKKGTPIEDFDLLIGCTAITNDMVLVTDNLKHFAKLPVKLQNWINR